jgi:VWFA-related protein
MFKPFLLAFGSVLLATAFSYPQSSTRNSDPRPIKLETELVQVDAQVLDRKTGAAIHGLTREEFVLLEDGARQVITHFGQDTSSLSVVLLLDCAKQAAESRIEWVRRDALEALQMLRPEDEVALMAFGERTEVLQDFTKDRQALGERIGALTDDVTVTVGESWDINEAIYQAATQLAAASNPYARRLIIAVTWNGACREVFKGHTKEEATNQLLESGSVVCDLYASEHRDSTLTKVSMAPAIVLLPVVLIARRVDKSNPYLFWDPIGYYARQTGGRVALATSSVWPSRRSARELASEKAKFVQFIELVRTRYSLAYVSSNQKRDGTFRKIKLRISASAEKREGRMDISTTRRGYYARRGGVIHNVPPDRPPASAQP